MNDQLYFIPMIAKALQQAEPVKELRAAMEAIKRLGCQPRYARGYQQFLRFMNESALHRTSLLRGEEGSIPDVLAAVLVERVAKTIEGSPDTLQALEESSLSRWREECEQLAAALRNAMERPAVSEIHIRREEVLVATCPLEPVRKTQVVSGIIPGGYRLAIETGRVLWEGHFGDQDLLWSKAFPTRPLNMAADTGESIRQPTRQFILLEGALIVCSYAGLEAGSLELDLRNVGAEA